MSTNFAAKKTGQPRLNHYGLTPSATNPFKTQLGIELSLMQVHSGSTRFPVTGQANPAGHPNWWHFCRAVDIIWNYKGSKTPFMWHPWALLMIQDAFKYKRLAVTSGGSGGKTDVFAIYALVWWIANPYKNVILVNTTTLKDSMGRIWGRIVRYFNGIGGQPPGKLVASAHAIKSVDPKTGTTLEEYGIRLFAGEPAKAADSSKAIRGQKHGPGGKIIVILDEAAELGPGIVNTFEENITQNPNHQLVALANANSPFDTFGQICEPKEGGWDAYLPEWDEWEGKGAHVRRINIELSPNITENKVIYPFLMTREMLEEKREKLGVNSKAYWRGVLGAFLLDGDEQNIYSPAELLKIPKECVWQGIPTKVGALDISFTAGGDKSVFIVGKIGVCVDGKKRLQFTKVYYLNEDVKNRTVDRTTQIINQVRQICADEGIAPENLAYDATAGGGKTFGDAMWSQWSNRPLRVDFGGKASDRPVSAADREKSSVRFANRVSELWGCGKEFIRCDQLRDIPKTMAEEMCSRRYHDTKAMDGGSKIRVESKVEMKKRINKSPDESDAGFILIELCRERHGLSSIDKAGNYQSRETSPLKKRFGQLAGLWAA